LNRKRFGSFAVELSTPVSVVPPGKHVMQYAIQEVPAAVIEKQPEVVTPPFASEQVGVAAVVEIVPALASPASLPTTGTEEVTVVAVAAIGTWLAVMPDSPLLPPMHAASAPPF
jgi:hypothetical protein